MPLTPDEAIQRNKGKTHLQFERAVQCLLDDVENALADYTGDPVYVGLPSYLQYKAQADHAQDLGPITLDAVNRALHERVSPSGWKAGIVTNKVDSYFWAKIIDARNH